MHEIVTEIEIAAPAERVGARLEARLVPPGSGGMTFRPRVVALQANRELRWLGRLGLPGIFDGEHAFRIEPVGPGRVRFVHSERFSGMLVPLARRSLDGGTRQGFEALNRALKQRAEAAA